MSTSPVLVGFDGSAAAAHALSWGIEHARTTGRPLLVVLAVIDSALVPQWADVWSEGEVERARTSAERIVADSGLTRWTVEVRKGGNLSVLVAAAETSCLAVVGAVGHTRIGGAVLGSMSQHLARHSPVPVVVVRGCSTSAASVVVVGVDASSHSIATVEWACDHAEHTGAEVHVVHVVRPSRLPRPAWSEQTLPHDPAVMKEAERLLAECVAGARASHPDLVVTTTAAVGDPRSVLPELSRTASLLVVGARGHRAVEGLMLGSVSLAALRRAQCPVAVVR